MKWLLVFLSLALSTAALAENEEKAEKKALEQQAKVLLEEAKALQKNGQLLEAKARYAAALAFKESKDAAEAIKHIDEHLHQQVKDALKQAHSLYDQGQFQKAADTLENALAFGNSTGAVAFNLALCYQKLGETAKALAYLEQAAEANADPKHKLKLRQMQTSFTTGEAPTQLSDNDRDRISVVNRLVDGLGFDSSVQDGLGQEEDESGNSESPTSAPFATASLRSNVPTVVNKPGASSNKHASLCETLAQMRAPAADAPAVTFDIANCDEDNGRLTEAYTHLLQYLAAAPTAADAARVRLRAASLNLLINLPGGQGTQVRSLFSAAARSIQERNFDRALAAFQKAAEIQPEFPPTQWKLALISEAMANVDQAKSYFTRYRELETDPLAQQEADLHMNSLDAKKEKYDQAVEAANDIVADLLNRAMNLTFNGLEERRAVKVRRAQLKGKSNKQKNFQKLGGFTVPPAYARQQLAEAAEHLSTALTLFPLGAKANQLVAQVYLQANDGRAAMRAFDAVVSQNLPAAFYAEMRGHKQDRAVKCELTKNHVRLIFLGFYDKRGSVTAPSFAAGGDGLGDLAIDPAIPRAEKFESLELAAVDIKKVESKTGIVHLKVAKEDLNLSIIYLPGPPPVEGPQARRFSNTYTRLFVRYPGLEDSKLGNEGLTGGEKVKLAYHLANASFTIAMSLNPMGSFSAMQAFIEITRDIQQTRNSLRVTFAGWEKTIEDQQELQGGSAFKMIPTERASLSFTEDLK